MFKRILAAIDGSEHSTKAAEVAIELVRTYGSDLTILHR
jgi:nucleotide-binding universal stress UspA family protein